MFYHNREEAGLKLSARLSEFLGTASPNSVVLAISRGGVVVGDKIATQLNLCLDLLVIKKIGLPGYPEISLGAVDRDGQYVINPSVAGFVDRYTFEAERLKNIRSAAFEKELLSENSLSTSLESRTAIIVTDGIQTGAMTLAAVGLVKKQNPEKIIVASPVCSWEALARLNPEVSAMIVDSVPAMLHKVDEYYLDFLPESDEKVKTILRSYVDKRDLAEEIVQA